MPRVKSLSKSRVVLYTTHDLRSADLDDLSLEEKWTWVALRLLAADCPFRPILCLMPGVPLTDEQIAIQLRVPLALWRRTKKKLSDHKRILVDKRGIVIGEVNQPNMFRKWEIKMPTDEEIKQDEQGRIKLCKIWEEMVGLLPDHNNRFVVRNYAARKKEGATEHDFEVAARTYLGIVSKGTISQCRTMKISMMLSKGTFWKMVKINRPAHGRTTTTLDYYNSLKKNKSRGLANDIVKDWSESIRKYMTLNGIRSLIDIDWTKIMTCQEYLKRRMDGEDSKSGIWSGDPPG